MTRERTMRICPKCDSEYGDEQETCPEDGAKLFSVSQVPREVVDPLVGSMLTDRIRVDKRLGEGGMGAVYKGEDVLLGRTVAVKVMRRELTTGVEDVKRFFNEAKVVAKLRHPNTIQLFDFGESRDGHYYIAMEFMTGEPLTTYMNKPDMSLGRVVEIVDQVCQSLDEAHNAQIIHRDLKPDNVFIDNVNNRRLVKVIDFGIAKLTGGENLTQAGMVFGTPAYMSPEQAQGGTLDRRSDIYSLGVVLFQMLTGRPPFSSEKPVEVAIHHVVKAPPDVQEWSRFGRLPQALVDLVNEMLAKDPAARPQTAAEVRKRMLQLARVLRDVRVEVTGDYAVPSVQVRTDHLPPVPGSVARRASQESPAASGESVAAAATSSESDSAGARRAPGSSGLAEGAGATGVLGIDDLIPAAAPSMSARRRAGVAAGIAVAIAVVVAGVAWMRGGGVGDETESGGSGAAVAPVIVVVTDSQMRDALAGATRRVWQSTREARDVAEEATIRISIASDPAGASVVVAGTTQPLGETPLVVPASRGDAPARFDIALAGYQPQSVEVSRSGDSRLEVTLTPEPGASPGSGGPAGDAAGTSDGGVDRARGQDGSRGSDGERSGDGARSDDDDDDRRGGRFRLRLPVTLPNH